MKVLKLYDFSAIAHEYLAHTHKNYIASIQT